MSVRDRQFFDRHQTIAGQRNAVARSLVTYLLVKRNLCIGHGSRRRRSRAKLSYNLEQDHNPRSKNGLRLK